MKEESDLAKKTFDTVSNTLSEIILKRQDFYKTLLTLNTTTLLILIAFSDKLIRPPFQIKLILIPFVLFSISLICSLLLLKQFADYHAVLLDFQSKIAAKVAAGDKSATDLMTTKDQMLKITKIFVLLQKPALYAYLLGMLSLIVFAARSLFIAN